MHCMSAYQIPNYFFLLSPEPAPPSAAAFLAWRVQLDIEISQLLTAIFSWRAFASASLRLAGSPVCLTPALSLALSSVEGWMVMVPDGRRRRHQPILYTPQLGAVRGTPYSASSPTPLAIPPAHPRPLPLAITSTSSQSPSSSDTHFLARFLARSRSL